MLEELQREIGEAIDDGNTHLHVHVVRVAILAWHPSTKYVRQNVAGLPVGLAEPLASKRAPTDTELYDN